MTSHPQTHRFARDAQETHASPPPVIIRYFYNSPLAIDDPLSPLPPPASLSSTTPFRAAPRPFSSYDNAALDKAWLDVRARTLKQAEEQKRRPRSGTAGSILSTAGRRAMTERNRSHASPIASPAVKPRAVPIPEGNGLPSVSTSASVASSFRAALDEAGLPSLESTSITGNPFIRAPARSESRGVEAPASRSASTRPSAKPTSGPIDSYNWGDDTFLTPDTPRDKIVSQDSLGSKQPVEAPSAKVPVGVSRLHNVTFPQFQMEPIYWLPVGDIAQVIRGTWFYYDNMLPVEPDIANLLEVGYISLQAWSETWRDELNSAVDVGASGEMKILHSLWPEKAHLPNSRPSSSRMQGEMFAETSTEPDASAEEKARQEAASAAGNLIDSATRSTERDNKAAGLPLWGRDGRIRSYQAAGVIYANEKDAYVLRQNLQPSAYYGRRPLANYIRKNRPIGIRVIRGFDQQLWQRLHPVKKSPKEKQAREGVSSADAGVSPEARRQMDSTFAESERPEVTDLVLVIHGIGQKLSQRVESYHFTHAINNFRRDINVELGDDLVKYNLRKGMGGIMVLPVNWRLTLSFEDGGYRDESSKDVTNDYTLRDITPSTLPSVRNIVSDVMLDIPYYLTPGYHDKMVAAVVQEANRVYQLWCANNPFFAEHGKVHLLAHSLGSIMAVDILSSQPTAISLPKPITSLALSDLPSTHFAFNVSTLFLAGSPTGFFLLLKNSSLLPRRGHQKPGGDSDMDATPSVAGDEGTYGCLPVDNIYNIVNPYDPVAYCLNAAVDADYAASLKPATLPSAKQAWLSSFSLRSSAPPVANVASAILKPGAPRLPSTVEMETHDFSREEIAERKAYALNDNGQIDFYLRYGGGPLEIQYLTMLGAHSSYWISRDFLRMLVCEIGRPPGREGTLEGMRAVKKKRGKKS